MPKINDTDFIEINHQHGWGIAVNKYLNEYSIISARRNANGDIWPDWVYLQDFDKDGTRIPGKTRPMGVTLGLKPKAIQTLEQLIMMIEGRTQRKE